jgi:hypothetical protein
MDKRKIWLGIGIGAIVLLVAPFLPGLLFTVGRSWPPGEGEIGRYRVATEVTLTEDGRELRSKVLADCLLIRGGDWSTGKRTGITRRGQDPFFVLSDGSILILHDLQPCQWGSDSPAGSYRFNPDLTYGQVVDGQIRMPYSHAYRFDNARDPKVLTVYSQPALFRRAIDGIRVREAGVSFLEWKPTSPLPFPMADSFPWFRDTPYAEVGSPDYGKGHFFGAFSGFESKLVQLSEQARCQKFDRDAEGPILVVGDKWDTCPPWGGENLGWLVATLAADHRRIGYSVTARNPDRVGTFYRARALAALGAPGESSDDGGFFWRPQLCFDGRCFDTHAARRSTWEGFRLYFPKKNQVIAAEWKNIAVLDTFFRPSKSP